jgi:hypothetical protein
MGDVHISTWREGLGSVTLRAETQDAGSLAPIFVHASPRSGSTYFFNVLRRNPNLMCFNETIIDVFSQYGKHDIARFRAAQKWNVNHDFLSRDDFAEFVEAWDAIMPVYPPFPSFQDYVPKDGVLPKDMRAYLSAVIQFARGRGQRPVLCEIHSRGRAGALRSAFAGFHVAQYRDPISQFGSFFRPVAEAGEWGFLTFPLMEMGLGGSHPLYRLVPEQWRVPVRPWPRNDAARRWASAAEYIALVASDRADTIERAFRWHLFSWFLSNLAAVCYSDFVIDIDRLNDDRGYRQSVIDTFAAATGTAPDFADLKKFSRYYAFEGLDMAAVCEQVATTMRVALHEGRIEAALRALSTAEMTIPAAQATEMLLLKLEQSLAAMGTDGAQAEFVGASDWAEISSRRRPLWSDPRLRAVVQHIYPLAAPIVRAGRRIGVWH